jgi:putative intracellular protease/amidase
VPYVPNITLSIITTTQALEPVSPAQAGDVGAVLAQSINPQYTIYDAPEDLEVLLIPGGVGSSNVSDDAVAWVSQMVPKLRYLITVCTGADIAARAGALCGLRATTNKQAWVWPLM